MSARLVIHAEIDTHEDLAEVLQAYLQKEAANPFTLERAKQFIVGMAHGLTKAESEVTEPEAKEGESK